MKDKSVVLAIGQVTDPHIQRVGEYVKSLGAKFLVLDPTLSDSDACVSLKFSKSVSFTIANSEQETFASEDIVGVWWRLKPPFEYLAMPGQSSGGKMFAFREWQHLLEPLEFILCHAVWVNPRPVDRRVRYKVYQLTAALNVGFQIPGTLISNNPNAVHQFISSHTGKSIYKPLSWYFQPPNSFLFTNQVDAELMNENRINIQVAPGIFQEYIDKAYELRVTIVGSKIFAVRIESQHSPKTQIDWRRSYDDLFYSVEELPDHINNKLLELHKALALTFGAYDLIVTPDEKYIFLEVNPVGQWLWLENSTNLQISKFVATLLVSNAHP